MNKLTRNISSLEVAEMVGREHKEILRDIRNISSHLAESKIALGSYFIESSYVDVNNQMRPSFLITKKGCELYGTRMTGAKGTQFAVKYIDRFNEMEREVINNNSVPANKLVEFEAQLIAAKYASEMLLVDTVSKIKMLEEVHKTHGVPSNHLPMYVEEELKVSLTQLLKDNGVTMSAVKLNKKLMDLGILEVKQRAATKGVKEFKALTSKGLYYGANAVSPNNSKETQPLYYPSKFKELLKLI